MDKTNPELQLADRYVRDTGCHIFLTGKAGTGKTTFLRKLKRESPKRLIVTAPTGVAAINAGGVTLHSFFQLPFGPFVPGSNPTRQQYRFSREKVSIIKSLDLLVIDEISMVRADLLDGVDSVLRRYRRSPRPFGGVQVLMIGDLFQLPPVVRDEDWRLLQPFYASPYFFSSQALEQDQMVTIELRHIYRQADQTFIDLLNQVRNDRLEPGAFKALNARYLPDFSPAPGDGCITLSTHNRKADTINQDRLTALSKRANRFDARVEGNFPESIYPTAAALELKVGAQVMFVRNDVSSEKRYYNGKIGTISRINGDEIRVKSPDDADEILVEPITWENIEYNLDPKTLEIKENIVGTFRQVPLRLAWAITIHKSQGLTFDKAIIDAQAAFAYGQVYVALSRCRTLEGMVLSRPLTPAAIKTDPDIVRFSRKAKERQPSAEAMLADKIQYQQRLLLDCFDFSRMLGLLRRLVGLLLNHAGVVHVSGVADIRELQKGVAEEICTVGDNFRRQLQGIFSPDTLPAEDAVVGERVAKAAAYFGEKMAAGPGRPVAGLQVDTDNKAVKRKIHTTLTALQEECAVKLAAVQSCRQGFSPVGYFKAVAHAVAGDIQKQASPKDAPVYSEADIAHPELFQILKKWRGRKAEEEGVPHFRVLHQKPLIQIAVHLPDTLAALQAVKGIGKRLAERYGEELIELVGAYRTEKKIETVDLPTPAAPEAKPKRVKTGRGETKQVSLKLFEEGLNLSQIAEQRGLVLSTIETHMAHWVARGKVAIERLVTDDKRRAIEQELMRGPVNSFSEVKQALGSEYSYGEIRMVQAHLKRQTASDDL
jgi:hypothetical protein